jgi:N-glycosidase YbiA
VDIIYFYGKDEAFGEFSNFAPYGIEMDGVWWQTVEYYFQAQKFIDRDYALKISKLSKPKDVFEAGQSRKFAIHPDWDVRRDEVMYIGVKKKFETHKALADLLLSTGDAEIHEAAPHDYYWGVGGNGSGLNKLGKILMRVRSELA